MYTQNANAWEFVSLVVLLEIVPKILFNLYLCNTLSQWPLLQTHNLYECVICIDRLAAACWSFHYAKRLLETVFVHRFSHATMPIMNIFRVIWNKCLKVHFNLVLLLHTVVQSWCLPKHKYWIHLKNNALSI